MRIFILKNQSGNNLVYLLGLPIPSAIYQFMMIRSKGIRAMRICLISLSYHSQRSTTPKFTKLFHSCRTLNQLPSNSVVCITISGNRLMVYSHCMGMGQGPLQGPNGKYNIMQNVHTGLGQGQVPRQIVSYCVSPIPCTASGPIPVNSALNLKPIYREWHSRAV